MGAARICSFENFAELVPSNPSTFLMEYSVPTIACKERNEVRLPLNFGKKVESAQVFNSSDASCNNVIQTTDTSTKIRKLELNSIEDTTNQVVL